MTWNSSLHPRAAAGSSAGGQFTAGGSKGSSKAAPAKAAPRKTAKKTPPKPESLQAIAAKRAAGKPLTPAEKHQWHLGHVAHEQHLAALKARAAVKPRAALKAAPKKAVKARGITVSTAGR